MSGSIWIATLAVAFAGQTATPAPQTSPTPQTPPSQSPPQVPLPGAPTPVPPSQTAPAAVPPPAAYPGGLYPGGLYPGGVAAPGAPMPTSSTATTAAVPQPVVVNASMNQSFTLGALRFSVTKVTPGLTYYVLAHDQRGARLTPGFKNDRLVVVDVDVMNPSNMPASFTSVTPALVDTGGAMTNRAQWDVRQQSYVRSTGDQQGAALRFDSYLTGNDNGPFADTSDAVMVAPGGHVHFALIFSEPASARPGTLRFDGSQNSSQAAGVVGVVSLQ